MSAGQMMPEPYLEAFSATMDNNPPTKFARVRRVVGARRRASRRILRRVRSAGGTASIQVRRERSAIGKLVEVKVLVADKASMVGDVRSMLHTALALQRPDSITAWTYRRCFARTWR